VEPGFDLAHNAQGGTICMPSSSHNQAIHQAVHELLEGGSPELRRFQETAVKMNQVIDVSGVVAGCNTLTRASASTRKNESS